MVGICLRPYFTVLYARLKHPVNDNSLTSHQNNKIMSTNASNSSITAHPSQTKSHGALQPNLMLSTDSPRAEIAEGEPGSLSTTSSSSSRNDVNDGN